MNFLPKFFLPGGLLVVTLAFGFWVSNAGKPYNGILFNIHKLAALAAVVLAVIQLVKVMKPIQTPVLVVLLLVAAALCVVALFASGALMSAGKLDHAIMLLIHRVAPVMLVAAAGLAVYLLSRAT